MSNRIALPFADVLYAIGMVPELHASSLRTQMHYPLPLPTTLTQRQMKDALIALSGYLAEVRFVKCTIAPLSVRFRFALDSPTPYSGEYDYVRPPQRQQQPHQHRLLSRTTTSPTRTWPNIDVSWRLSTRRCYDAIWRCDECVWMLHRRTNQTNEMLVASLLRLPDNGCNVPECETLLRRNNKVNELFLLYEKKQMHVEGKINAFCTAFRGDF